VGVGSVSAVIVTWNGKDLLATCLETLRAQTRPVDEVLVVDNGSSDNTQRMVRTTSPEVSLIEMGRNTGFSIANNVGISQAKGEYIALLNNDLILDPGWVAAMVGALENHPTVGSCACKMLSYAHPDTIDAAGMQVLPNGVGANRGTNDLDGPRYAAPTPVFGACAGAAMYRASMLRDIGAFDEDLFIYYEDVDLSFRAQIAGYDCLYVPDAVVHHHHGASSGRFGKRDYYLARNGLPVIVKNMPAPLLRKQAVSIVVGQLPYAYYAGVQGGGRLYVRACLDSLALLPRMLRKRRAIRHAARRDAAEIGVRLHLGV